MLSDTSESQPSKAGQGNQKLSPELVRKVADRVVMVYPISRLASDEPQIIFDGPPSELDRTTDRRVRQFVQGEAGERLMEMRQAASQRSD